MSLLEEKLTRDKFRELHQGQKPYWELIDGCAEQKALPKKRHSYLQAILASMLEELGFIAATELTLEISETWEPIPDVAAVLAPEEGTGNQTTPPAVVMEILSPSDRFSQLQEKVEKYAEWGIADILVFDPAKSKAWRWDRAGRSLVPAGSTCALVSKPGAELLIEEAFARLERKIR